MQQVFLNTYLKQVQEVINAGKTLQKIANDLFEFESKESPYAIKTKYVFDEIKITIKKLEKLKKDKVTIGVIGQVSSGKSTFLNALIFGDRILPAGIGRVNKKAFKIEYGDAIEVIYEKNDKKISETGEDLSKLREKLTILNEEQSLSECITIRYPKEILKDLIILDTPGIDTLKEKALDAAASNDWRIVSEIVGSADAIIFITDIDQVFGKVDKELWKRLKDIHNEKRWIVLNKADSIYKNELLTPEEKKEEFEKAKRIFAKEAFGSENWQKFKIFTISAQEALIGIYKNDKYRLEQSKFNEFFDTFKKAINENKIKEFLKPEIKVLSQDKLKLNELIKDFEKDLKNRLKILEQKRELTVEEKEKIKEEIEKAKPILKEMKDLKDKFYKYYEGELKVKLKQEFRAIVKRTIQKINILDLFKEKKRKAFLQEIQEQFEKRISQIIVEVNSFQYFEMFLEQAKKFQYILEEPKDSKSLTKIIKTLDAEEFEKLLTKEFAKTGRWSVARLSIIGMGVLGRDVILNLVGKFIAKQLAKTIIRALAGILGVILSLWTIRDILNLPQQVKEKIRDKIIQEITPQLEKAAHDIAFLYQQIMEEIYNKIDRMKEELMLELKTSNASLQEIEKDKIHIKSCLEYLEKLNKKLSLLQFSL